MISEAIQEAVRKKIVSASQEAVLAELDSMADEYPDVLAGNKATWDQIQRDLLIDIQQALVYLSDRDGRWILTQDYRRMDWRDLLYNYQLLSGSHQLEKKTIQELIQLLHSPADRLHALTVLGQRGTAATPALPVILSLLDDPDQLMVTKALRTITALGPVAREASKEVGLLQEDSDSLIRYYASKAMAAICCPQS